MTLEIETVEALETRSVVDALRSELQKQILRGSISPGAVLTELSVAQRFDVARPTAKAAIEQLAHIGLVRRMRNKSARIPRLDASDIPDIYLSRSAIESAATRILAERGEIPVEAAAAIERFRAAIGADQTVSGLVESDVEFHRALVAATRSPRLRRLHDAVIGEAHLCMAQVQIHHLLHPQVIAEEHLRILSLIAVRDVDAAVAETNEHLARAGSRLVAYLRQQSTPAAAPE
jgi:DNA-binding GntR family transcriptional regulator